jgi:acyl-CoA dehydrogenase family protein 9
MSDQSFMKSLFHGVLAEELISPYPDVPPEDREVVDPLLDRLRKFAPTAIDSAAIDREGVIPEPVLAFAKAQGLFGLRIGREQGGLALSTSGSVRVMQEVASIDPSLAFTLAAHGALGTTGLLLFGSDMQRRKYLPRLARGESIAAFALSEPSAGSDAAAIQLRADRAVDGEGWVLNGKKAWVTNGAVADLFTVFARTSPADQGTKPRLTSFVVERSHGVRSGHRLATHGVRGSATANVSFDAAKVPAGNVLGDVGRGFKVAMEVLNLGRLSLAGACVGQSRKLLELSIAHAQQRRAFGRAIGEFGLIKDKISRMVVEIYALESAVYLTTGLVDARIADYSLESAICKVLGSETLHRVAHESAQIAAGPGFSGALPWERLMRDARLNLFFAGTNEILRCFIALSGMQGPGRALAEVSRAMREPIKGFGLLSDFALRRAKSALGRERAHRVHPILNKETVLFEEHVSELAKQVERALRKHGSEIAEMQYTQRRVADLAIDLYALAACLARTTRAIERKGEEGARREIELTTAFGTQAQERMGLNLRALERNDDELFKGIATRTYGDGGYPFDVL